MELVFKSKLSQEQQTLNLDKAITTFIGGNGSGKSSILEAIFEKYIEDDDARIICFSSGQNELFTDIFSLHRRNNRRHLNKDSDAIKSFYFDSSWVRLLVFWSTIFKRDGRVRSYLKENHYIKTDDLDDDISSILKGRLRVRKYYADTIKGERTKEEKGEVEYDEKGRALNLISNSNYHNTLEKLIVAMDLNFDFVNHTNLKKTAVYFNSNNVYDIFPSKDVNELFTFWAHATNGYHSQFDIDELELYFDGKREFKYLSDGEYQLLAIYAIIDLFDNQNTLFLLDEIDSHLYYENLFKMWKALKSIDGKVLTSTHISDSILNNDIKSIKLIENGKIKEDLTFAALSERLGSMLGKTKFEFKILSRVKNAVLIDDHLDWRIFKNLARIKLDEKYDNAIDQLIPIKKSSGYSQTETIMGRAKLNFINNFKNATSNLNTIETENIFAICDLDNCNLERIKENMSCPIHKDYSEIKLFNNKKTKTHLLVWKRLEIENYLLCPSMLEKYDLLGRLKQLFENLNIEKGNNLDWSNDIKKYDAKKLIHSIYKPELFEETLFKEMFSHIIESEISEDIIKMHDYISSKLNN